MINIAIAGAAGRMGRALIEAIGASTTLNLTAAIVSVDSSLVGVDVGEISGLGKNGICFSNKLESVLDQFDVLIDFTIADACINNILTCTAAKKHVVIGTTGFNEAQLQKLRHCSEQVGLVMAPNFSVGVNATFKLIEMATKILGEDTDIEIFEAHHRNKVDAPSGTAIKMGQIVADQLGQDFDSSAVYARQGVTGVRAKQTIGFSSLRGGDIIGEHTVTFAGAGERLEITHRAHSRTNFAQGALRAAQWLATQNAGLFDMQDVLGIR